MPHNRATIYSNGIADFQRIFPIESGEPTKISIPVCQQHLGDVLASLTISGQVKIVSPPSYQPANQADGNIVIATGNALTSLANQLAGADVEISFGNSLMAGKLVGVHEQQTATSGEPIMETYFVVLTNNGLSRVAIHQTENLRFVEESIQSEIDKALNRRLQNIKPNSTFVDLELGTDEKSTDAIVQYTIPAAAWKISYRLLITHDQAIEFHGHAIVDNNTDEDWQDFVISVVMGQPISFTTDLADSKTPRRSHVNIVQESALGAVEVEEAMPMMAMSEMESGYVSRYDDQPVSADASSSRMMRKSAPRQRVQSAQVDEAAVSETGDFCIFESSGPVSIAAHRSAVIPVFTALLDESKPVLHFKTENHAERPFRALQFKNTTEHSLGRGVCTVYDGTTYAGSCVLPATKPDGDALLPHALETAVMVRAIQSKIKTRRTGIRISKGVALENNHQRVQTEYQIQSSRNESFHFMLDHTNRLHHEGEVEIQLIRAGSEPETLNSSDLKNGRRIEFRLLEKDRLNIHLVETAITKSRITLAGASDDEDRFRVSWLFDNLVESNSPLSNDPAVAQCIELQRLLDETKSQISLAGKEIERLENRQKRLRENIKTGGADPQTAGWRANLARAEDNIVGLEEKRIPELRGQLVAIRQQLYEALKGLEVEWKI